MHEQIFKNLEALLEKAGIPVSVAAMLFKTSRPTIYSWCAGNPPNQELLRFNALRIIKAIESAVAAKALPYEGYDHTAMLRGYDVAEVRNKIALILRGHLNGG